MGNNETVSGLIMELRRGTIVLSVLITLKTPMYGYNLVDTLSKSGIDVEANTLYPLLRRLESQGLLTSTWETGGSKPRKYYVTTTEGTQVCNTLKDHFDKTVQSVNNIWEKKNEE